MRNVREILRLHFACGLSVNKIHECLGAARSTIDDYLRRSKAAGLSWPLPEDLDDRGIELLLFPSASVKTSKNTQPDCVYINKELKRKGVTLSLLWQEYRQENSNGYGYSQFTQIYRDWSKTLDLVMRQEHKAGEKLFSDFAGTTVQITDRVTGEVKDAHIFVAALGASGYTYAEAFFSEDTVSWCLGHAHTFRFLGGAPLVLVPDNPKTTVSKACRYEPDINPNFHYMASHYGCVVIPARVRHPKDKSKVELSVGLATRWIVAALRNQQFFSLHELNEAIWKLLEVLNNKPFQKLPGSRRSQFEEIDKPALRRLPQQPYQYTNFHIARVNIDYHVELEGHWYSVPYKWVKQKVELRVTSNTIEVFAGNNRIASHIRSAVKGRHSTKPEHMPAAHREYLAWTPQRMLDWAEKLGPNVAQLIEKLLNSRAFPEQGLGILRLGKHYGQQELENACQRALTFNAISYKSIKSILDNKLETHIPSQETSLQQLKIIHSNLRGADYFKEENAHADTPHTTNTQDDDAVWNG